MIPAFILLSSELRWNLNSVISSEQQNWLKYLSKAQLVPFFDVGQVWDLRHKLDSQAQGQGFAIGIGMRYSLFAILNLRLDYAWGKDGRGKSSSALIVDLSQAF